MIVEFRRAHVGELSSPLAWFRTQRQCSRELILRVHREPWMKHLEHIEHCKGQGQLFRERTLRFVVLYDIDVYRELTEPLPDMAPVSGLGEIRGFLTGLSEAELWSLQHQPLTRILSGRRELELELGAKGEIIPHGEFHSPH